MSNRVRTIWARVVLIGALALSMGLTGCSEEAAATSAEKEKLVQVQVAQEEAYPVQLSYTGLTTTGELRKYSFKISGKLQDLAVKKGDYVKAGQRLASLDTTEYGLALEASQLNADLAEKAYNDALDTYEKSKQLFEAGAISQSDLDKTKLNVDDKETTLKKARLDLEAKQIQFNDAQLYADMEGYVVEILFQKSEIVGAGYPVVVIRSPEQKVSVGLSQNDVYKVKVGDPVEVTVNGQTTKGKVERIDAVPDEQTRTYNAEILITEPYPAEDYFLGVTAEVKFSQGEASGIWVPLACILNDGEDYLFVVQEGRAAKRNITILDVQGFQVLIEGLEAGEQYVTSGMKSLKEGNKVKIQSEVNTDEQ